jgi:methanogenic corrinoid protein MtbC1
MMPESVSEQSRLAHKLVSLKQPVAQVITEEFFLKHPEWTARYGERGRRHCTADACFHMEFLAGAIEAGSPEAFGDYLRWTARMLGARGISAHTLEENVAQVGNHLSAVLLPQERDAVATFLTETRRVCRAAEPDSHTHTKGGRLGLIKRVYLTAILSGQRQAALNIIAETLEAGNSHVDIYVEVFAEAQHEVGKLWELNKIGVAQEHMATAITLYVIAAIYPRLVPTAIHRGVMVVSGVSGEMHQIGANLFADTMEANGWTVRFLGTDLPNSSVLAALEDSSADLLCLSTTLVSNLPAVADLVRAVRSKLGERPLKIILGGAAYRFASTHFAREVGATEVTDLRGALATLCGPELLVRANAAQ